MDTSGIRPSTAFDYRQRVCVAMNYISQNLDRELPLEEIADVACFSRFHFHRIFKAVVGETVAEFTRRLRLEMAACRLLGNQSEDITSVALRYGFSSSQNFARAFRAHFGLTPTQYRIRKAGTEVSKHGNALTLNAVYAPEAVMNNQAERSISVKAEVKEMPQYNVAYVRKMGPYGKETCGQAFGELSEWAGPRGHLQSGVMLGVYWDNPEVTPADKCRVDACVTVPPGTAPGGAVALQTIAGGPHAVCRFEIGVDGFRKAWEDAFAWLVQSGRECDDKPCYELYHNDASTHPQGMFIVDVCIPLKPTR